MNSLLKMIFLIKSHEFFTINNLLSYKIMNLILFSSLKSIKLLLKSFFELKFVNFVLKIIR